MARNDKRFLRPCAFLRKREEKLARATKSAGGINGKGTFALTTPFLVFAYCTTYRIQCVKDYKLQRMCGLSLRMCGFAQIGSGTLYRKRQL